MTTVTTVHFTSYGLTVCGSDSPVATSRMSEFRNLADGYRRCPQCASAAGILSDDADHTLPTEVDNAAERERKQTENHGAAERERTESRDRLRYLASVRRPVADDILSQAIW